MLLPVSLSPSPPLWILTWVCLVFDYPVASSTCLCMEMTVAIQAVCPFVPSIYDLCAIRKIDVASFYRGCLKAWLVIRSIILKREFDPWTFGKEHCCHPLYHSHPKMAGLSWKLRLKWMIEEYPHFRKPPFSIIINGIQAANQIFHSWNLIWYIII